MIVYAITNTVNGKRYIGMTEQPLNRRWMEHKCAAKAGVKTALHAAIRKYGVKAFTVEVLVSVEAAAGRKTLGAIERAMIAEHKTLSPQGYNLTLGGDGLPAGEGNPNLGRKSSEKHKAKVAASWTPKKRAHFAEMLAEKNRQMALDPAHGRKIAAAWTPERRAAQAARMAVNRRKALANETFEQKQSRINQLHRHNRSDEGRRAASKRAKRQWEPGGALRDLRLPESGVLQ